MSWKISSSAIAEGDATLAHWKNTYEPGDKVPTSGIYRCLGCKREITSNANDPFPPQNHHQHNAAQGAIRWKLNVKTNTEGK